jgi:hypothetical protein
LYYLQYTYLQTQSEKRTSFQFIAHVLYLCIFTNLYCILDLISLLYLYCILDLISKKFRCNAVYSRVPFTGITILVRFRPPTWRLETGDFGSGAWLLVIAVRRQCLSRRQGGKSVSCLVFDHIDVLMSSTQYTRTLASRFKILFNFIN